jgi:hypothetical protein
VTDRDAWIAAFPYRDEAAKAIAYLCTAWNELAANQPDTFSADEHEPRLTEILGVYLHDTGKQQAGLRGRWGHEVPRGKLAAGRVTDRIRTDIEYWSNRLDLDQELELTIEFKRLDALSDLRRKYYGESGMGRFVTGEYSLKRPIALMAGILLDDRQACVDGLRRALHVPDIQQTLGMMADAGVYLREPSAVFPESAMFDTEHRREEKKAPAHGTIRISHLFLGFPNPPTRRSRKARRRATALEFD